MRLGLKMKYFDQMTIGQYWPKLDTINNLQSLWKLAHTLLQLAHQNWIL